MKLFQCGHPKTRANSNYRGNGSPRCRICRASQREARRVSQPEKFRARNYNSSRSRRFGKSWEIHWHTQIIRQKHRCAICRKKLERACQDHDHSCCPNLILVSGRRDRKSCGECLRGILCPFCNTRLGWVESLLLTIEVPVSLKFSWFIRAQNYLLYWKKVLR